jgi:hypothetical protein
MTVAEFELHVTALESDGQAAVQQADGPTEGVSDD